jgi:hypothetical protein
LVLEKAMEGANYSPYGAFRRQEARAAAFSMRSGAVDKYAAEWLFIAHFHTES